MNLLFVLIVTLVPKNTNPVIHQVGKGRYNVVNPLNSKVIVILNCGLEYNMVDVAVEAKKSTLVDVSDPSGEPAVCWMESYKRAK